VEKECVIALMANKIDIMFNTPEERQVLKEQGELFAREHKLLYLDECSALAGINIDETFMALAESIKAI
jgi:hypothetical protein